ncbi:MAG: hypothetical protein EBX54_11285 [Betaproteobacteria bacterium]|nr:hypothetical protein [Betaproteobacteria bacterium]
MTRRWFGTDGIRGPVGRLPMTPEFVLRLGQAAGKVLMASQAEIGSTRIDHDLHAPQVKPLRKAALTKLDITPCSVIDAPCSTHLRCSHTTQSRVRHRIAFQVSLDTRFNRIG